MILVTVTFCANPLTYLPVRLFYEVNDGDFAPNPACYPSVKKLVDGVRAAGIPELMFSFWPEVTPKSAEYTSLLKAGCLINPDLGGLAFDATIPECRELVWRTMLKPRYYDQVR